MNVPQPSEAARPAIPVRASDADREQAAAVLQAATADGRLPVAELDERLGLVYNAKSKDELASIVKDLQPAAWPGGSPPAAKDAGVLARRSTQWTLGRSGHVPRYRSHQLRGDRPAPSPVHRPGNDHPRQLVAQHRLRHRSRRRRSACRGHWNPGRVQARPRRRGPPGRAPDQHHRHRRLRQRPCRPPPSPCQGTSSPTTRAGRQTDLPVTESERHTRPSPRHPGGSPRKSRSGASILRNVQLDQASARF